MKKKSLLFIGILCTFLIIMPGIVDAKVKATGVEETVKEEIDLFSGNEAFKDYISKLKKVDLSNYKEDGNKVNVYMFRGDTCSYCLKAITYFSEIVKDYGDYFNLITYEVWQNAVNAKLMEKVAKSFKEEASGVPYIVIGDKTFTGYSDDMNGDIESQIKKMYNSTKKYDVMDDLKLDNSEDNTTVDSSDNLLIIILLLFSSIAGLVIYINYKNRITQKILNDKIGRLENEYKKNNKTRK